MGDKGRICGGNYDTERAQCLLQSEAEPNYSLSPTLRSTITHDNLGPDSGLKGVVRANAYGNLSRKGTYSGLIEASQDFSDPTAATEASPIDLQMCWDPAESMSICGEYSEIPFAYEKSEQGSLTASAKVGENWQTHAGLGVTDAFFNENAFTAEETALFNAGVDLQGRPYGKHSLLGVEYYRRSADFENLFHDGSHALALKGITGTPFQGGDLFLSGYGALSSEDPLTFRGRTEWLGKLGDFSARFALTGARERLIFQERFLNSLGGEVNFSTSLLHPELRVGLGLKGTALKRAEHEATGHAESFSPYTSYKDIVTFRGDFRNASPPIGGHLKEIGAAIETGEDFLPGGIEGITLFLKNRQSVWEDPLFEKPKIGNITEAGGEYCIGDGEWCFGSTIRRETREGFPLPTGEDSRSYWMATARFQDQPGGSRRLNSQLASVLAARGVSPTTGYYPKSHYASPPLLFRGRRPLFRPSPLPGGVWPFQAEGGLPPRADFVAENFNEGTWYGKAHAQISSLRNVFKTGQKPDPSNPSQTIAANPEEIAEAKRAFDDWRGPGHADALKKLLAQGRDGVCGTCHGTDLPGEMAVNEWLEKGDITLEAAVSKNLVRIDPDDPENPILLPNPWYSPEEAEASDDYTEPEQFILSGKVRCQIEGCHAVEHDRFLKHIYDLPGGRHHGADAMDQIFSFQAADGAVRSAVICSACHILPGSHVINPTIAGMTSSNPFLECDRCHEEKGPMNHAPGRNWKPLPATDGTLFLSASGARFGSGGLHGKQFEKESAERGEGNTSCRSCHDAKQFCLDCHSKRGPESHVPDADHKTWGPTPWAPIPFDAKTKNFTAGILGVRDGGRHGPAFRREIGERGDEDKVSCNACHEAATFCSSCHSRVNTHGETEMDRALWGRGGRHKWYAPKLVMGAKWMQANKDAGTNCYTCHIPEDNCFNCHSGKQTTGMLFHDGQRNRHQADLDTGDLNCNSCHTDQMGSHLFRFENQADGACQECHRETITGFERSEAPHVADWGSLRPGHQTRHGEEFCNRGGDYCATCHGTETMRQRQNYSGPLDCNNQTCHSGGGVPSCNGKGGK